MSWLEELGNIFRSSECWTVSRRQETIEDQIENMEDRLVSTGLSNVSRRHSWINQAGNKVTLTKQRRGRDGFACVLHILQAIAPKLSPSLLYSGVSFFHSVGDHVSWKFPQYGNVPESEALKLYLYDPGSGRVAGSSYIIIRETNFMILLAGELPEPASFLERNWRSGSWHVNMKGSRTTSSKSLFSKINKGLVREFWIIWFSDSFVFFNSFLFTRPALFSITSKCEWLRWKII